MSGHEYGPLLPYEVTWRSGHVETVMAHQVLWPQEPTPFTQERLDPRVMFHGEVEGRWQLILVADEHDILSVRRLFSEVES